MPIRLIASALAAALALPFAALAQSASTPARADARPLEAVQVTATRRAESRLDVPVATTVLTREALRSRAPQTVLDALHGEAGTFVQQTTPGQSNVIVRGLKGSEVLHLVDGFRLNNAIFRNAPNQYLALVDSQMLDGIEVVRGPMSTLYGGDAMGGVVQFSSHAPRFTGDAWRTEGGARAIWSSADRAVLSRVEGAAGHEAVAVSGGLTYQNVNPLRVGGGERLPFTAFTARGGNARVDALPADGHELMFQTQYFEQPDTPRFDELVPGFGQTRPTSSEFAFSPQVRRFHQARWTLSNPTWLFDRLALMGGRQVIRDDRRSRDFGSVNRDSERNTATTDGFTVHADKSWADNRYLSFGVEWYDDSVRSARSRTDVATDAVSARPSRFPDRSSMRQLGIYANEDWQITPALDLLYGLRWSRIETRLAPVGATPGVAVDDDDLSGNVGVNYAIDDGLRIIANAGRGFRAPNVFDLGVFGDRPGNRFQIPNPDLKPEVVTTFDAGFKFEGAAWSGELVAFRSRYRDKITAVVTGALTPSGRIVVESRNATRQTLNGFEGALEWRPSDRLRTFGTATWTRGDETLDGIRDPADRVPPIFGKFGAEWAYRDDLSFEGYVFYATRQDRLSPRDRIDPRIDPSGTAGWATLNAHAAWQVSPKLDLSIRLENLADTRYREHGSGIDEPGRSIIATVDWRF